MLYSGIDQHKRDSYLTTYGPEGFAGGEESQKHWNPFSSVPRYAPERSRMDRVGVVRARIAPRKACRLVRLRRKAARAPVPAELADRPCLVPRPLAGFRLQHAG